MLKDVGSKNPFGSANYITKEIERRFPFINPPKFPSRVGVLQPEDLSTMAPHRRKDNFDLVFRPYEAYLRGEGSEYRKYPPEDYVESMINPDPARFHRGKSLPRDVVEYGRQYQSAHRAQQEYDRRHRERERLREQLYAKVDNAPLASAQDYVSNPYRTVMTEYFDPKKGNKKTDFSTENSNGNGLFNEIINKYSSPISITKYQRSPDERKEKNIYDTNLGTRFDGGFKRQNPLSIKIPTRTGNPYRQYLQSRF
jgi:hypothetical protein